MLIMVGIHIQEEFINANLETVTLNITMQFLSLDTTQQVGSLEINGELVGALVET